MYCTCIVQNMHNKMLKWSHSMKKRKDHGRSWQHFDDDGICVRKASTLYVTIPSSSIFFPDYKN